MGAMKEAVVDLGAAALTLTELYASDIDFVLTAEHGDGYRWYLVNMNDEYEQEDWIFHALKHGQADTFEDAVDGLAKAVVGFYPLSAFAQARRPRRRRSA